jgi:acyl-[acyl-carrier-protein]-phospholipid O-acyltransferase/long-chain-fatty-acid--[acyl-carrier-protein] ligase
VVITSKAFVERFPNLVIPGRTLFLEDALAAPRFAEKMSALGFAWLIPSAFLRGALGANRIKLSSPVTFEATGSKPSAVDGLATVIFSSGSTGDPKGVMLTHFNIMSNIQQVSQVFMLDGRDKILGILPFFHSFGFMAALWMPATNGVGVVYHPNPLDAQVIGALVEKYRVTFLIATPTFLQAYMRRCKPESFGSLQFVLVGAEKLQERVALAFEDTFGIRPLEGYGCTECSPVVTVNGRDFRAPGFRQVGGQARQNRPPASRRQRQGRRSRHRPARRAGNRGHAAGERTQRDEGLSGQAGEDGRSASRWLVHHRRRRA